MKTLIITGGNIAYDFALSFLKKLEPDYVIGVDKGLQFCFEAGISPDYIVGDFDSLDPKILQWYKLHLSSPIREYNPVKDATDTMIALQHSIDIQSEEIWILGGTGTRMDHVFCNIQILKNAWKAQIPAYLVDENNLITLLVGNHVTLKREQQYGTYVSFFPLEEMVEGLTLIGFKYPLEDYLLKNFAGLGVSNEIVEPVGEVSWNHGLLLMMQSKDA